MNTDAIRSEEVRTVQGFFAAAAAAASGSNERVNIIKDLFLYLAASQEVLKSPRFRQAILDKIDEMRLESPEHLAILEPGINALCQKLVSIEGRELASCPGVPAPAVAAAAAPPVPMPAPAAAAPPVPMPAAAGAAAAAAGAAAPAYNIIGSGTFGAVFTPALSNTVGGVERAFPGNVTKMFYDKKTFDDAMNKIALLPTVMGVNAGQRANRYTRAFKARNLPAALYTELKAINPRLNPTNNLHVMRMPHLGKDVDKIGEISREVRRRPFRHILGQFQKLFHQTARLAASGYGHFDIRTSNVMVTPSNGNITIVDFDWLHPFDELWHDYPLGFYANPPESLLLYRIPIGAGVVAPGTKAIRSLVKGTPGSTTRKELDTYVDVSLRKFSIALMAHRLNTAGDLFNAVMDANIKNYRYLISKHASSASELAIQHSFPTFDNYGLAMTLLEFVATVYPFDRSIVGAANRYPDPLMLSSRITNEGTPYSAVELAAIKSALNEIIVFLLRTSSFELENRPTPAAAAAEIDRIAAKYDADVAGAGAAAAGAAGGAAAGGAGTGGSARRSRRARRQKGGRQRTRNLGRK